jgi:non-heme chloroperoxidase
MQCDRIGQTSKGSLGVGFFSATDGTQIFYQDWGSGDPVVFTHSWLLDSNAWEYQFHALVETGLRCIGLDRRGHGRSDVPGSGYDYDTLADDLAGLLQTLDLRGVTLVGHSMGGGEIVRYLTRHGRDRVARIALVAATVPGLLATPENPVGLGASQLDAFLHQIRTDRPGFYSSWKQAFFGTNLNSQISAEAVNASIEQARRTSPLAATACLQSVFHADFTAELRQLDLPVLIIHGTADANNPIDVTGRRTAALLPGAQFKEYDLAAHGLFMTHAGELNSDLLAFIKS